jgi:hypothetical protein
MKQLFNFKRLDSRGMSHLLLPMVVVMALAVGGTYMLVSSHANPATNLTAASSAAPSAKALKKVKKGYIVVYSANGTYKKIKLSLRSPQAGRQYNCGGVTNAHSSKTISIPSNTTGKPILCLSTGDTARYNLSFVKSDGSLDTQGVDVDAGYCTLVHPSDDQATNPNAKVAVNSKGNCTSPVENVTKKDVTMRVLVTKDKKTGAVKAGSKQLSGFVELKGSFGLSRVMCTGSLNLAIVRDDGDVAVSSLSLPIKYTSQKIGKGISAGYCVAKFANVNGAGHILPGHAYTVSAHFNGNNYLNAVDASQSVPPIPAAKASNGGTAAH